MLPFNGHKGEYESSIPHHEHDFVSNQHLENHRLLELQTSLADQDSGHANGSMSGYTINSNIYEGILKPTARLIDNSTDSVLREVIRILSCLHAYSSLENTYFER